MSGLPQYQNVFRIAKNDAARNGNQTRGTKRNRQPVSCMACRARKSVSFRSPCAYLISHSHRLRCDRQVPCTSCTKRGDTTSCSYSMGSHTRRDRPDGGSKASEAQLRLQKLEEMVTGLMQTSQKVPESIGDQRSRSNATVDQRLEDLSVHTSPENPETSIRGHLDYHGSETNYLGATHWATILENVAVSTNRLGLRYQANLF